mmetsp:Transcript_19874/g.33924  ORF Transcript_19874/g.33924 Transcript_19874/m.33924 type:complete len:82 (+) Transcript_19874:679-924(+)
MTILGMLCPAKDLAAQQMFDRAMHAPDYVGPPLSEAGVDCQSSFEVSCHSQAIVSMQIPNMKLHSPSKCKRLLEPRKTAST